MLAGVRVVVSGEGVSLSDDWAGGEGGGAEVEYGDLGWRSLGEGREMGRWGGG